MACGCIAGVPGAVSFVLDASALLTSLHDEPGGEKFSSALEGASVSAVNWSEVQKSLQRGVAGVGMRQVFTEVGASFEPFTPPRVASAAWPWSYTRNHWLSLAVRACWRWRWTGGLPAITVERVWVELKLDIEVWVLR